MTSEIVILITELRNKQRITLPAGSYRFGRSAQCEYVLRRNNVGDHQFTVSFANGQWGVTDGGSDYRTWYSFLGLDADGTPVTLSADAPLSTRRAVLVYDEEKSAFTLLPGSSQELCYLGGDAVLTPQPLTGGETLRMGGAAMKFVPFCGAEFHW